MDFGIDQREDESCCQNKPKIVWRLEWHMIDDREVLAEEICDRLIEGESMRSICSDPKMPSRATLLRWIAVDNDFATKCARARLMQADTMDDMVLDIIGEVDEDNAQAMKVKLSAIQWRASKLNPKKYGDKIQQEVTGADGAPLLPSLTIKLVRSNDSST
jgi:hypothetical protein